MVPEARKDVRLRRYEPRSLRFPVGNRSLRVVIPAAREWLRRGTWARSLGRDEEPPYWVEVWPASMTVVWALSRCDRLGGALAGLRVLDLGCGLGLPGVVAASLGACVTFCDREPDALAFATWNAKRAARGNATVDTVCGDWQGLELDRRYDVIVLADVTYRTEYHERLLALISSTLVPGGVVIHADPRRDESTAFLAAMADALGPRAVVAKLHRETSLGDKRVSVRLVVAGQSESVLTRWSQALGLERQPRETPRS